MAVSLMSEMEAMRWQIERQRSSMLQNDLQQPYRRIESAGWSFLGDLGQQGSHGIADKAKPVPAKPKTSMLDLVELPKFDAEDSRAGLAMEVEDLLGYTALRKDAKVASKLERVLQALEIDVYKPEKVNEYKTKMQAHFQAKADNADRERIRKTGFSRTQTTVSWKMVGLGKYTKPVPEHVLRKCVQIKKAAPEAEFFVDELVEETRTLDPFMVVKLNGEQAAFEVWDEPEFEE